MAELGERHRSLVWNTRQNLGHAGIRPDQRHPMPATRRGDLALCDRVVDVGLDLGLSRGSSDPPALGRVSA